MKIELNLRSIDECPPDDDGGEVLGFYIDSGGECYLAISGKRPKMEKHAALYVPMSEVQRELDKQKEDK